MKIPINIPILGNEEINAVKAILREASLTSTANIGGKTYKSLKNLLHLISNQNLQLQ